jgi:hypothetical protein
MKERDNEILIPKHAVVNPLENLCFSRLPVTGEKVTRPQGTRNVQTCLKESLRIGPPVEKFFIG